MKPNRPRRRPRPRFVLPFLFGAALAVAVTGCPAAPVQTEEEAVVVPPGKKDDFYAPRAREYRLEGTTTVTLESSYAGASEEERLARVQALVPLKQVVIGWFLNAYLIDKSSHDANGEYGGFQALTKNGSWEDLDIQHVEGETYQFRFSQEVGGTNDFLEKVPTTTGADGKPHFDLVIGKISNSEMARLETNYEWYRSSPWSEFDPSKVDAARLDHVDVAVTPEPRSVDAWIDYDRLFADGVVEIGAHFGWDYHSEYHLKHSRETYQWLLNHGFESPVASWDDYGHDSGPLTRTITADGREVLVKVWIRYGKPGTDTDPDTDAGGRLLEDLMREDFAQKDVVLYSGHSGAFYGFALANWRTTYEGDLDDSEIPSMEMPSKYQVVLAEGCDTYGLGQSFWMNPAKAKRDNLDVITTTSFSNAATANTVTDFLEAIVGTDGAGDHQAKRFGDLLGDLDSNSYWFNTMYGVHGIDDNPHLHPYARTENLCAPCESDGECGGQGNVCAKLEGGKVCATECTADDGCPDGYKCLDIARGSWLTTMACVPASLSCDDVDPSASTEGRVVINEVGADPSPDLTGDWNHDGVRNAVEDEFVELVNTGAEPLSLAGWTLSDGVGVRFVFPQSAAIPAHGAVLVFGGGVPAAGSFHGTLAYTSDRMLGLNNGGDTLTLADDRGSVVDAMTYGDEGGENVSLVRTVEGDPEAAFGPHPGPDTASPGTRADGTAFGG